MRGRFVARRLVLLLASLLVAGNPMAGIIHFQMAGIVCLSQQDGKWAVNWVMPPELLDRKDRP